MAVLRSLQTKQGDSHLHTLQSCMSMASEMDTVFLEDLNAARPHFKAIRDISEKGRGREGRREGGREVVLTLILFLQRRKYPTSAVKFSRKRGRN